MLVVGRLERSVGWKVGMAVVMVWIWRLKILSLSPFDEPHDSMDCDPNIERSLFIPCATDHGLPAPSVIPLFVD